MAIGLFGTPIGAQSDQDIVDRIRQEQQIRNQRLTQGLGKYAGLAAQGMETAQGFNTDVGRIFGIQDPRLQKNTAIREAGEAVKARGVNMNDPVATLTAFSEELMKRGLYQEATALIPQIQQAQRQAAQDVREQQRLGFEEQRVAQGQAQIDATREATAQRVRDAETKAAQDAMKPVNVGTTNKGIVVFRRGAGGLTVEESGNEVPYSPAKHGRFETSVDRRAPTEPARPTVREVRSYEGGPVVGYDFIYPDGRIERKAAPNAQMQGTATGTSPTIPGLNLTPEQIAKELEKRRGGK